ncbi:anaerobic sulfatase maturase [Candidatus Latescibacterota bacterium]
MMKKVKTSRDFQIFAKPIGSICNMACEYCYYLEKKKLYPDEDSFRMTGEIFEQYIIQHIAAATEPVIGFSWHGGEPTLLGLDYFKKIVAFQYKHCPSNCRISNGIQTNGILLDDDWCGFFKEAEFAVGLSLDGPQELHDRYRVTKNGKSAFNKTMHGYELLQKYGIYCDILCVVNAHNVRYPAEVYRFFKEINARHVSFLPLVEQLKDGEEKSDRLTLPAEDWGMFLCTIFDEWIQKDIGKIKVQIFEEALRTAFGQEHSLCIFRPTCGDIPVIEHNGDFFSCDHFVDSEHYLGNIKETSLADLLESPEQRAFGQAKQDLLPRYCISCEVREMCNGGCPKNRFIRTPDGEKGLNYLCEGYKRFFNHCKPFVSEVANLWRHQKTEMQNMSSQKIQSNSKSSPGRNDPCPCGSGLKYKKCCMDS